ncbi:uncharacterized protein RHOBADRAFT_43856 [Rhodotorula graminis WP1]|uniref:Uncharacterized protein n=1 Tax=Rhodotorula graminis (strain WP1) TaxID=578459 RepID=A0A194S7G1_RHOGW|nr:uncharacterized protein RHOBADRAFT_43856 [Rhodotorula graminis WP1]KPV75351.1 hypothetical protein RHOBADRAFT_43856 [Rhodotorula graminis WP1]
MLHRHLPAAQLELALDPAAPTPAFPGLVSSIRPLKRIAIQLADEHSLLSRFTYKHKNQHKGTGWWRRVVHVDRAAARALAELDAWLAPFTSSTGKDEVGSLTREVVCAALLRLPRVMLMVEKNLEVLLNTASTLDQLVDSRAFLALAVVIVALTARLHALFAALLDECTRTAATLLRLIENNQLLPVVSPKIKALPRTLRRFLSLDQPASAGPSSLAPSLSATPHAASPAPAPLNGLDDIGAAVERRAPGAKPAAPRRVPPGPPSSAPAAPRESPAPALARPDEPSSRSREASPSEPVAPPLKKKKKKARPAGADLDRVPPPAATAAAPSPSPLFPFPLDDARPPPPAARPPERAQPLKRVRSGEAVAPARGSSGEVAVVKKKKKVKRKGGDEIDDIFG